MTATSARYSNVSQTTYDDSFTIGIFHIGDLKACCYSFTCPCCAMAESRHFLDGSPFCFNIFCLPLAPYRWLVRSAYGIGDQNQFCDDILLSAFCSCCVVNQLYQTTVAKGNPSRSGGLPFNTNVFPPIETNANFSRWLKAFCCMPCSQGDILYHAVGMPYFLGCCCMNLFTTRNIFRYQYRIKPHSGDDVVDECLFPTGMVFLNSACQQIPCFSCAVCALYSAITLSMLKEIVSRPVNHTKQYLSESETSNLVSQEGVQLVTIIQGEVVARNHKA